VLDGEFPGIPATLDARPDTLDFRDRMFEPTLVEVPRRKPLEDYLSVGVPVLRQDGEGACTGFGLATVAHYLLRKRRDERDETRVSPRMLYEMAKRYDEWPGERYEGSSARGAMKGWHKHGVCAWDRWKYAPGSPDRRLTQARLRDALQRPLGAYYRVNHRDLVSLHAALAEVGVLYATATVHQGWGEVGADGVIRPSPALLGGHAFAVVGYEPRGFWIQNSWGARWGREGFGLVGYDDWLENATDVWVARLGAPVELRSRESSAISLSAAGGKSEAYAFCDVRPHVVSLGNDGSLRAHGAHGTSREDLDAIFETSLPEFARQRPGRPLKVLLYAHGGLVDERSAVQRAVDYRAALLDAGVWPISFVWKTDYWTTLKYALQDAVQRRRPEGVLDSAKDFMLDRLDDMLEPLARLLTGKASWDEMKENAVRATVSREGGVRLVLDRLTALAAEHPGMEVHVAAHSAGSIFMGALLQKLATRGPVQAGPLRGEAGLGLPVRTCTLWAPACTVEFFEATYGPLVEAGDLADLALFTLTDEAERADHCANIYHKSLLYLVSHAFEERFRMPGFRRHQGEPILGMEKFARALDGFFDGRRTHWVRAPNQEPLGSRTASRASHHGDFDDDGATLRSMLARILGDGAAQADFCFHRSAPSLRDRRKRVDQAVPVQPAI
jgi:hypothetical protein